MTFDNLLTFQELFWFPCRCPDAEKMRGLPIFTTVVYLCVHPLKHLRYNCRDIHLKILPNLHLNKKLCHKWGNWIDCHSEPASAE